MPNNISLCVVICGYFAMYARAYAAASFTLGSNSSRQMTRASSAPLSTTAWASVAECLATALRTNASAFL